MVMSSTDIAMMMSQQNQMFMGQQQFAQQIGLPMGGGYQQGGGFNYAPSGGMLGPGYAGGNRFAGGAMSAMGAAASVGGMGLGVAGMLGKLGPLGALTDPIAGGMAGFARFGLAGAMGGAALPLGLGMAASHVIGSTIHGGQQQQMIGNQLGQFQFFNPAARGGMGFTRQDTMAIGDQIRAISHVPEMMTSVQELTKLLPKLKSSGMMQGVRDATEFAQRFKESIKTIRDVSKTLGTTMEEAADFFAHSRGVGFLGRQAQMQNVLNAQFTSGVTGMNMGQVMGLQQAGAGVAQQMGASRRLGATAVTNIAQQLGVAQQQGRIKEGQLEDVTGLQGPEAIQAMATRFAGAMAGMAQSTAPGRLSIAGMVKFDQSGKAIGIDEEIAKRYREGTIGVDELRKRASNLTNAQKISFTRRIADISMDYAGKAGVGGMGTLMQAAVGGRFGEGSSEAVGLLLQRHGGMTTGETDIMQALGGMGDTTGMKDALERIRNREAQIREKTSPEAILRRLKTRVHAATTGHLEQAGAKVFNSMARAYEEFIDDVVGRHVVQLSQEGAQNFARAMAGGGGDLKKIFAAAHGTGGPRGLQGPGRLGKIGAGMAALGGVTGMAGQAMLGADLLYQNREAIGESGLMNALRGGRTAAGASKFLDKMMGGASATAVDDRGVMQGHEAAAEAVDRLRLNIEGYRDMSHEQRLDAMRSQINKAVSAGVAGMGAIAPHIQAALSGDKRSLELLGGDEGMERMLQTMSKQGAAGKQAVALIRAGRAGQAKLGIADMATATIATAQSGMSKANELKIMFGAVGDKAAASQFDMAKAADQEMKAASKRLEDTFGAGVAATLKSKPEVRSAVRKALFNKDIKDAIHEGDTAKLAKLGVDVKSEDIGTLRDVLEAAEKNPVDSMGAINDIVKAQDSSDKVVLRANLQSAADDLIRGARTLSGEDAKLVSGLGDTISEALKTGDASKVQASLMAVSKRAMALKDGDRTKFLSSLGGVGAAMSGALGAGAGLREKKSYSKEDLGKELGLEGADLTAVMSAAGATEGKALSKSVIDDLRTRAVAMRGAEGMGGKKGDVRTGGDVENKTLLALQEIQKINSQHLAITQAISTQQAEANKGILDKLIGGKENANAGSGGNTETAGGS